MWLARLILVLLVTIGVWRVMQFDKAVDYTLHDLKRLTGRMTEDEHLSRFGGERSASDRAEKYVALEQRRLGDFLRTNTGAADTVFVFGFSSGAYVHARRESASRFFWSRPVIIGFNEGKPRYGAAGMLAELAADPPKVVALQRNDWELEGIDSAGYFMKQPALAAWLRGGYTQRPDLGIYQIWMRK